jgi:hypothetical protein
MAASVFSLTFNRVILMRLTLFQQFRIPPAMTVAFVFRQVAAVRVLTVFPHLALDFVHRRIRLTSGFASRPASP